MTATLIQIDLAARTCPPETAGTVFALLMALENLSASASTWLGGVLYDEGKERWGSRRQLPGPRADRFGTHGLLLAGRPVLPGARRDAADGRVNADDAGDAGLEQGLGADDRALVGERVERMHGQASDPCFDMDVADRRGGHPVGGGEAVEEPAPAVVENHLVAQVGEDLGIDAFDVEAGLVVERISRAQRCRSARGGSASGTADRARASASRDRRGPRSGGSLPNGR